MFCDARVWFKSCYAYSSVYAEICTYKLNADMPTKTIVLIGHHKRVLVFHKDGFQQLKSTKYREMKMLCRYIFLLFIFASHKSAYTYIDGQRSLVQRSQENAQYIPEWVSWVQTNMILIFLKQILWQDTKWLRLDSWYNVFHILINKL